MNGKISYFREMYGSDRNIKETNRRKKHERNSETWGCFTFSGVGHLHRNDSTLTTEKCFTPFFGDMLRSAVCIFVVKGSYCSRLMSPNRLQNFDRTP